MQRTDARYGGMPVAWWAALALLIVNDHVLKGGGLLPGWLTGKLSDFAGLVVAPLLGCAALGLRSDRARAWIFGAVAMVFAAIKLHEPCAVAAAGVLTAIGIPSRIWCDPTDLIALGVLPWAAQLARAVEPVAHVLARHWPRRIALAVAALACAATSEDGPSETEVRPPFLINWTHAAIEVEVERRLAPCGDAGVADGDAGAPITERFALPVGRMVELGVKSIESAGAAEICAGSAEIRIGEFEQRVTWRSAELGEMPDASLTVDGWREDAGADRWLLAHDDVWFFQRAVTVIGSPDAAQFEVGRLLHVEAAP